MKKQKDYTEHKPLYTLITMSNLQELFNEGEQIIATIESEWATLWVQRALIDKKTQLILEIGATKKANKDSRLVLKTRVVSRVKALMEEGMKKTPAEDQVSDETRADRYELEKIDIDLETMGLIVQNRSYHLRINEIDLNKVGIGADA